jgi:precorrin-3B synthase
VGALDAAIRAEPRLVELGGRFWFSIDDGRADVSGLGSDVGVHVCEDGYALLLMGRDTGLRMAADDVVATLIGVAVRFTEVREKAWRINELDDIESLLPGADFSATPFAPVTKPPVGWIAQDWPGQEGRIALGAAVPLGVLPAQVAEYLAVIEAPMVITPWRSLLVCDLDEGVADAALRVLAPLGLVFDENSPWLDVSACTGSPGCTHSAADVRADAAQSVGTDSVTHRHFVGCERACGSPPTGQVLLATSDGYRMLRS